MTVVIAFDAYGTLLDTSSIAERLGEMFGQEKGQNIAVAWRKHQLEYTWRLNSMNTYVDFEQVTRSSLRNAVAEAGEKLDDSQTSQLMQEYDSLKIFPDTARALEKLRGRSDIRAVVFSNGTSRMVARSVKESKDLQDYVDVFEDIVVVEDVKRYKPAPETYDHLVKVVNVQTSSIWLVSGNPFDIVGARKAGFNAAFIDRAGAGWNDHILDGPEGAPTAVCRSLEEVITVVDERR